MEITYRREMKHNYMIVEPEEMLRESYETHMMASNGIGGLLRFHIKQVDSRRFYYYEITSKQPLSRILEYHSMGKEELGKLISGIAQTLGRLEFYLLTEDQVILEPEYIYIEPEQFTVFLCLVPGGRGRFPEKMTGLLQYLLGKVNHQDKECVVTAYALYQESLKENYGMNDLLEIIGKGYEEKRGESENAEEAEDLENLKKEYEEDKNRWNLKFGSRSMEDLGMENKEPDIKEFKNKVSGNKIFKSKEFENGEIALIIRTAFIFIFIIAAITAGIWKIYGMKKIQEFWYIVPAASILAVSAVLMKKYSKKLSVLKRDRDKENGAHCRSEEAYGWQIAFEEDEGGKQEEKESTEKEAWTERRAEEPIFQTSLLVEQHDSSNTRYLRAAKPGEEDIAITYVPYLIGKQEGLVDKVLDGDTVSRIHARIDKEGEQYRISDLNSTNGTSLNGRLLEMNETAVLNTGDEILIAEHSFIFT